MRYDAKYKIIAHAVVADLLATYGSQYEILNNPEAITRLGWAIQQAVQRRQLLTICADLELKLPEKWDSEQEEGAK